MEFQFIRLNLLGESTLVHAKETFGFIPNLESILRKPMLKGSMAVGLATSSFRSIEQQISTTTVNYENVYY